MMFQKFIFILFFFYQTHSFDVTITSTNNLAAGTANHIFLIQGSDDVIFPGSYILIQYDPVWTFTPSTTGGDNTSDYCDTGCTITSVLYKNTSNLVNISGLFPTLINQKTFAIKYTIKNIINPSKVYSQNFDVNLYMSNGIPYSFTGTSISVSASTMICTGVPLNKQISNITSYTFTINPSTSLPSTGYMIANFPTQWSDSSQIDVFQSFNCSNGLGPVNCSNSTNATIKLLNLISSSGSSAFSFFISGIRNPGHLGVNQELSLSYYTSTDQLISKCTVQISGLTPRSLTNVSFDLICNTSNSAIGILRYTVQQKPKIIDKMIITLPPEIYVYDIIKVLVYAGIDPQNLNKQVSIQSVSPSNSKISFFPFKNQIITNFRSQIYYLRCPPTIKQTINITIDIIRMGTTIVTHQCCNTSSSLPQFQTASVSSQNNRMAQITNYRFSIKINQTLGLGATYIDLLFPTSYNLVIGTNYSCYIQGYTQPSNTLCRVQTAIRISLSLLSGNFSLIMANLKSINIATSLQLYITLIGIQNPSVSLVSLNVSLTDNNHYQLQATTGISLSLVPALISGVTITPLSYQAYNLTTYTFRINNTNVLAANSLLRIKFPSQIKLQGVITKINGSIAIGLPSVNGSQDQLNITLPNTIISQYSLYSYIITIDNIRNPQSYQLTDSFTFQLESNGNLLQSIYDGLSLTMNQSNAFSFLTISLLNNTVLQHTQYTVNYGFLISYNLSKNYMIKVIFPSEYKVYACLNCTSFGQINITSNSSSVKISQVQNPYKTTISSNIIVQLYINNFLSLQSNYLISSFIPIVQDFTVKLSNNVRGQAATYWISGKNLRQQMKQIRIQLPIQVTVTNISIACQQCQIFSFNQSSKLIRIILNKLQGQNATFKITGINNPKTYPSNIFTFSTYSFDTIMISQSTTTSNYFDIICLSSCATCDSVITSKCLSCYQDANITTLSYLDSSLNTCKSNCSLSQFLVGSICYPCSISCNTCFLQASNCTSCTGSKFLFNNKCVNPCPSLYYGESNICQNCSSPCLSCSNSSLCTYCIFGKVLWPDGSCQNNCSTNFYNNSNICTLCSLNSSNCLTCDISGCISCLPTYYLINGTCLNKCPFGYFIDNTSLKCQLCQSPCKYCEGKSNNCTGCDIFSASKYFLNNQCLNLSCSNTYYADQKYICRKCVSPCLNCNSQTNCTSCVANYSFYSPTNQCFTICINKTIQIGNQCIQCQFPCLTCSINETKCTSCRQNYFLDQTLNKCNSTCNLSFKPIAGICTNCKTPCAQCLPNQPYKCSSCIGGYYFLNNNCYSTCPSTTYSISGQCLSCSSGCYECNISSSNCTSCYPGTYKYNNNCVPSCPIIADLYQYQSQCIFCQFPCQSCLSTPIQCKTCNLTTDFWNPVTLQCKPNCTNPFFNEVINGTNVCKMCEVPCKTCTISYDKCASCVSGKYLNSSSCINQCPDLFYTDNGSCVACPSLCQTCTKFKCKTCKTGNLLYKQSCYSTCPAQAPYAYTNYCRNCLKDNCLFCNTNNECVMCFQTYKLLNGDCLQQCPLDYEPDLLTQLSCVKKSQKALYNYLKLKQKQKLFLFPGSIIMFFIIISVIIFPGKYQPGLYSLISIVQNLTTIILIYFYINYSNQDLVINFTIPWIIIILIYLGQIILSCCYLYKAKNQYMRDQTFKLWYQYGSNQKRTNLIFILSIFNLKLIKILFSGLLKLPFTSYQFKDKSSLKYLNWMAGLFIAIYNIPMIAIALYIVLVQKVYLTNNKLFYSTLDCLLVQVVSVIISGIYLYKQPQLPQKYTKNIIEGISNLSIQPLSQSNQQIGNQQENDAHLFHSNSVQDIKKSEQMKQVQFKSVYDPSDFQDPPHIDPNQFQHALKNGKFRTKQKPKKKGKGKYRLDHLQIIQQQISDEQQKINDKRRTFKNKNKKQSLVNNYIYWQPPKQKKNKAQQIFKQNKKQIMKKIYQKQSEFDTITNNDIIFMQESDQQSYRRKKQNSQNFEQSQNYDSKRQLNPMKNQFSTLFNLNYAKRKHLQ